MAVRKRKTTTRRTVRRRKKSGGGHPFLVVLFFVGLICLSAYVTDRMTNAPDAVPATQVTAIHHLFNDKEMQGVVPADDPGTPESVKEKVKAALNKVVSTDSQKEETKETAAETKEETSASAISKDGDVSHVEKTESAPVRSAVPEKSRVTIKSDSGSSASAPAVKQPAAKPAAPTKKVLAAKPAGKVTGRLAVVIDDAGRDLVTQHIYENMGIPLTLAIMPNQSHTTEAAQSWKAAGLPFILHQPMESVSGVGMEPKVILTSMGDADIRTMLKTNLAQVPGAIGINNHQGSKATTDRHTMDVVMNELHHRGLFFFDSRTNSTTQADAAAKAYGVPYVMNDLFVDNSTDVSAIESMIQEGADRAKKNGTYVIIGHCRPHTAEAFKEMVPKLRAQGIEFVYVASLAK